MNRIYRHGEHLQRKLVAMTVLAVYLHIERRNHVHLFIKRCQRIVATHHHAVVAYVRSVALTLLYHFHSRRNLLLRFERWQLHLIALLDRSLQMQHGLLSYQYLQRVDALLYLLGLSQA